MDGMKFDHAMQEIHATFALNEIFHMKRTLS